MRQYAALSHFLGIDTSGWAHPGNTGWYRIRDRDSRKRLAVDLTSTADRAPAVRFEDNGTVGHLWQFG